MRRPIAAREKKSASKLALRQSKKNPIARPAALRGSSVTNFVVASAQQAASETIMDFEPLPPHDSASDAFVKALLNPPAPNVAARSAARRYKKEMAR